MKSNEYINIYASGDSNDTVNSDEWKVLIHSLLKEGQSARTYYRKGLWKYVPDWIFALSTKFRNPDITYTKTGPVYIDILSGELVKE